MIHLSSGDIGVSASIELQGTPPFQLFYHIKRDNEPMRDLSKTITTFRDELTLQPARSGKYVFAFFQISDANYKKVELHGPTIDQVIPQFVTADFVGGEIVAGSKRRLHKSCESGTVAIEVELKVSNISWPPWV